MRLDQIITIQINNSLDLFYSPLHLSGDDSIEDTPDPIPNSEVKLYSADGTARETSAGE